MRIGKENTGGTVHGNRRAKIRIENTGGNRQ
jgi:hypothetical protein